MARAVPRQPDRIPRLRPALLVVAVVALAGCQLAQIGGEGAPPARASADGARLAERDVEAPEVFDKAESGLWDGRPSLGGIWVAHPAATDPERVVIRNTENGASVTGALFRRERENPGPLFQISSEAANALEILPGQPTQIRVTALRLEQVEIGPPVAAPEDADGAESAGVPASETDEPRGIGAFFQRLRTPFATAQADESSPASRAMAPAAGRLR